MLIHFVPAAVIALFTDQAWTGALLADPLSAYISEVTTKVSILP